MRLPARRWTWVAVVAGLAPRPAASADRPSAASAAAPNVVLIVADDLGYGDLSCFGSRAIRTPALDAMAADGIRLTAFTTTSAVCSPSRAAMLTGRYAARFGIWRVLFSQDSTGLPASEVTLAEALRAHGYATGLVGKWHLGHRPEFFPTRHGFDYFFGLPLPPKLYRNEELIDENVDASTLVERFTEESIRFIHEHKKGPFFLWLGQTLVHAPVVVSPRFQGKSAAGVYGDAVQALDWSTAQVLDALRREGIDRNTLVIFLSDNGPADLGSTGGLRSRKGSLYEGGLRVPFIARWPARIPRGRASDEPVNALDLFPSVLAAAGIAPKGAPPLDGDDVLPLLTGATDHRPPRMFLYLDGIDLEAARFGRWKIHTGHHEPQAAMGTGPHPVQWLARPELFDLTMDPGESYDLAAEHEDVLVDLVARMRELLKTLPDTIQAPLWAPPARSLGAPRH